MKRHSRGMNGASHPSCGAARAVFALTTVSLLLIGCDTPSELGNDQSGVTVRDSAGIRIVENHDSIWTDETRWRVAEEPDFVIGSFDGSVPGTDFGDMVMARALGENVVVSDLMSVSLRVFDDTGVLLERYGSRGDGPTELSNAGEWDTLGDDSVVVGGIDKTVVFDRSTGEASSYSLDDPPVEADTWDALGIGWILRGWFADGSYLMVNTPDPRGAEPGYSTQYLQFEKMRPGGEYVGPLGAYAMQRFYTTPDGDLAPIAFQTVGHIAVEGMHLWHAFADSLFEVRRIDAMEGRVDRLVRLSVPPTRVDPEMLAGLRAFEDGQIEMVMEMMGRDVSDDMLAEMERSLAEMRESQPDPRFAPMMFALRPTPSGHLLVELPDWEWRF